MVILTLARKPLPSTLVSNVAIHGTGGIHIDACRVSGATGRWPPNLLLSHLPSCISAGTRQIKGNRTDTRPEGDAGRSDKSQWRFRPTDATQRGYSDLDGTETISSWSCTPGCPAFQLDSQSGHVGAAAPVRGTEDSQTGQNGIYGTWGRVQGVFYNDTGSASRFFPQFAGSRESPPEGTWTLVEVAAQNLHTDAKTLESLVRAGSLPSIQIEDGPLLIDMACAKNLIAKSGDPS